MTSNARAIHHASGYTYVVGYGFNKFTNRDEALLWTTYAPCPGDLDGDGFVDDVDFPIFASAYDRLDCADGNMPAGCPADMNGDHLVDDADFVIFARDYDLYICP